MQPHGLQQQNYKLFAKQPTITTFFRGLQNAVREKKAKKVFVCENNLIHQTSVFFIEKRYNMKIFSNFVN